MNKDIFNYNLDHLAEPLSNLFRLFSVMLLPIYLLVYGLFIQFSFSSVTIFSPRNLSIFFAFMLGYSLISHTYRLDWGNKFSKKNIFVIRALMYSMVIIVLIFIVVLALFSGVFSAIFSIKFGSSQVLPFALPILAMALVLERQIYFMSGGQWHKLKIFGFYLLFLITLVYGYSLLLLLYIFVIDIISTFNKRPISVSSMKTIKTIKTITDGEYKPDFRLREAARGIFLDENGLVPLLYIHKEKFHKLPGGGIEQGETPLMALHREMMEETGATIEVKEELGMVEEIRLKYNLKQISYCYFGRILTKGQNKFDQAEIDEGSELIWLPFEEAMAKLQNDNSLDYEAGFIKQRDLAVFAAAKFYYHGN